MHETRSLLRVDVEIFGPDRDATPIRVCDVLVDSGSEFTWIPGPVLTDAGLVIPDATHSIDTFVSGTRRVCAVGIRCGRFETQDDVVVAEPGDPIRLGARTLKQFAALVDLMGQRLIPSHSGGLVSEPDRRLMDASGRTMRGVFDGQEFRFLPNEPLPEVKGEIPAAVVLLDEGGAKDDGPARAAARLRAARQAMQPLDIPLKALVEQGRER